MPVLYEHWRPDLNECFYVGISWFADDTRPYDMKNRNIRHIEVQDELLQQKLSPEIRVQKFQDISKEKLEDLEILMIAHWRQYIGDRLTNISPGGGIVVEWSEERRLKQSETLSDYMIEFYRTEEGIKRREYLSTHTKKRMKKLILDIGLENYSKQASERLTEYFKTPKGIAQAQHHSSIVGASLDAFYSSEEGKLLKKHFSEIRLAYFQTPQGKERRLNQSNNLNKFYASEEGELMKKHISEILTALHKTPEGEKMRQKMSQSMTDWWESLSPVEREDICAQRQATWDSKSEEDRNRHGEAVSIALSKLPEGFLSQRTKKWQSQKTFEQRSNSAKKAQANRSFEEKSETAKKRQAKKTPEQRSASTSKGWETRRARLAALKENNLNNKEN